MRTGAKKVYVNNGFWDTCRTAWAVRPADAVDSLEMIEGFVQHYRDSGWIALVVSGYAI